MDVKLFRTAMGTFCTGVTLISTGHDGLISAITANAFTSVSLDPPLILVCVDKRSRLNDVINACGRYAVSILSGEQEDVSNLFGRPSTNRDDYMFEIWEGLPVAQGALVHLAADLHATTDGGDHQIYVGRVTSVRMNDGEPLLYYRGGYHDRAERLRDNPSLRAVNA